MTTSNRKLQFVKSNLNADYADYADYVTNSNYKEIVTIYM